MTVKIFMELLSEQKIVKQKRIILLDELRGTAVILMIIYHTLYSMTFIFHIEAFYPAMRAVYPYEPVIPIIFITICGIVCSFSRNNLKRGMKIFLIALAVTLVTYIAIPSQVIIFGILHFLGISLMTYPLLKRLTKKINCKTGALISIFLFILFYNVPKGYIGIQPYPNINLPSVLYEHYFMSFFGFPSDSFNSSDYFPIIPHIFLFIFGIFAGEFIISHKMPAFIYRKHIPFLDVIGKHALIIYVIHQPLIIGILYIITSVSGK